jgi:hypothetical protein
MRTYRQVITAGQTIQINGQGRKLYLMSSSAGNVDIVLRRQGAIIAEARGVEAGLWMQAEAREEFDRIDLSSPTTQTVQIGVTGGDSGYDRVSQTITIQGALQLQVNTTIATPANITVGTTAVQVATMDATRQHLRFLNRGTAPIALGPSGVTMTNTPLLLNPGDYYDEGDAAGAAWWAISSAAGQTLSIMEVRP